MAESSWPDPDGGHTVLDFQYEIIFKAAGAGLAGVPSDAALAYADGTGRNVKIRNSRRARIHGYAWDSGTTDLVLPVAANTSGALRKDLVVLRLDRATWHISAVVKTGNSPTIPPVLQQDGGTTGLYEIPVATVDVANAALTLTADKVNHVGWYVGQPPMLCTPASSPAPATGLVKIDTATGVMSVAKGSTGWQQLVSTDDVSLGNVYSKTYATIASIGSGATYDLLSRAGTPGGGTLGVPHAVPVAADRNYSICAVVPCLPNVADSMSARLNVYSGATLIAGTGRTELKYSTNNLVLLAYNPTFRTSPSQTSIALSVTLVVYGDAGQHVGVDDEYSITITDLGTAQPSS